MNFSGLKNSSSLWRVSVTTGFLLFVPTALSGCGKGARLFKNVELNVNADAQAGAQAEGS